MKFESKYLLIKKTRHKGKTSVFAVHSKHRGTLLGKIKWDWGWRKYVFWPELESKWSDDCMSDIARFIKEQIALRRPKKKEDKMLTLQELRDAFFPDRPDCPYCNGTGIARNISRFKQLKTEVKINE